MLVLLDRDGVINVDRPEGILKLDHFIFLPRAIEGIAMLTRAGFHLAVCTNQSAVGRGNLPLSVLDAIHTRMGEGVEAGGGRIDRIYFASDLPGAPSLRRKPAPGMLLEAMAEFDASPARTPMVGDMLRDMEAAAAAGCPRILTRTGKGAKLIETGIPEHIAPVKICDNLYAAAEYICAEYGHA